MITHFGAVDYTAGVYSPASGSGNWTVAPVEGFDPPIRVPVGLIEIMFDEPITTPYAVLVSAERTPQTQLVAANYGKVTENGFVVHMWDSIADRTVVNCGFSFAVMQND